VKCSYLEIYNETCYDLLSDTPGTADNLVIVDDHGITQVKGLRKKSVGNEEESLAAFFQGENLRSTAAHTLNSNSSRSHVVFTVHLEIRSGADEKVTYCKLNFVDLAGSERTKKSGVTGQALREAQYINRSLSFLEQTVNSLSRKEAHVPFRQTKLTAVLKDALGGNCKTVMIGCIWGEDAYMEETVSTLRFATRVKTLTTDISINERNDPTLLLRKYERQIAELKQELAMRDTLSGRNVSYDDLGELEKAELKVMVRSYLQGEISLDEVQIANLKQIKETYNQFKLVYDSLHAELKDLSVNPTATQATGDVQGEKEDADDQAADSMVGDEDADRAGFQVGQAPGHLRPAIPEDGEATGEGGNALSPSRTNAKIDPLVMADKHTAFESYKHAQGSELSASLKSIQLELKDKKISLKELASKANHSKKRIDQHYSMLNTIRSERATDADDGIKSEEFEIMQILKAAKHEYRSTFGDLKELKDAIHTLEDSLTSTRQELVSKFDSWYAKKSGVPPFDDESVSDSAEFQRTNIQMHAESTTFHAARKDTMLRKMKVGATMYHGDKGRGEQNRKLEANRAR